MIVNLYQDLGINM